MKRLSGWLLLLAASVPLVSGCGRGRVIPKDKMVCIYADMLIADQWLKDHPGARKTADTTFFYEPVFKKYGYNTKDYDASLRFYLKTPDKFSKIMEDAASILDREVERLKNVQEEQKNARNLNARIKGYSRKNFADSLSWGVTLADSILLVLKENAERRDSIRTDTLETAGQLVGSEPVADEGQTL